MMTSINVINSVKKVDEVGQLLMIGQYLTPCLIPLQKPSDFIFFLYFFFIFIILYEPTNSIRLS